MTSGRLVMVVSDQKPLATILKKPLSKAPRSLQSMIMNPKCYAINLVWQPDKEMHIADCLSRAFLKATSTKAVTLSHKPANLQSSCDQLSRILALCWCSAGNAEVSNC